MIPKDTSGAALSYLDQKLSDSQFRKLSDFITREYGIKMPAEKRILLQSRLQRRLRALHLHSFKEYIEYAFSPANRATEVIHMMDAVSTNKTDFYRENEHFGYLENVALPQIIASRGYDKEIKVWSAGCSSGEEPYTIAFVVADFLRKYPSFRYRILATDISSRILEQANGAVYKEERAKIIPMEVKKRYLLKSRERVQPTVKIRKEIRDHVQFMRLNLMDRIYQVPDGFDAVFCRNVLIYFSRERQEEVLNKLCGKLKPGGYLFIGHSESITHMDLPVTRMNKTIFQKYCDFG